MTRIRITYQGKHMRVAELAKLAGISHQGMSHRLRMCGMSGEAAMDHTRWRPGRHQRRYEYRGQSLTVYELAELAGIPWPTMYARLYRYDMTPEKAVAMGSTVAQRTPLKRLIKALRRHVAPRFMSSLIVSFDGITQSISEWALDYGIPATLIVERLHRGWSIPRAITEPMPVKPGQRPRSPRSIARRAASVLKCDAVIAGRHRSNATQKQAEHGNNKTNASSINEVHRLFAVSRPQPMTPRRTDCVVGTEHCPRQSTEECHDGNDPTYGCEEHQKSHHGQGSHPIEEVLFEMAEHHVFPCDRKSLVAPGVASNFHLSVGTGAGSHARDLQSSN